MTDRKKPQNETTAIPFDMDSIAERYLDLWQDNVKRWATDPEALEKWLAEMKKS